MADEKGNPTDNGGATDPKVDPDLVKVLDEFDKEGAEPVKATGDDTLPDFSVFEKVDFDKIPIDKLPANLRERMLMHKDYTQKTQALADDRRKLSEESLTRENNFLKSAVEKLQSQGVEATPDLVEQIRQKIADGDPGAVADLVQAEIQRGLDPVKQHLAITEAIGYAERSIPHFKEYNVEVENVLRSRPDLQRMAAANGYAMATAVLEGITVSIHAQKLEAEIAKLRAEQPEKIKEALREQQRRLGKLSPTSSRVGGVMGSPGKGDKVLDARESAEATWKEMGLPD